MVDSQQLVPSVVLHAAGRFIDLYGRITSPPYRKHYHYWFESDHKCADDARSRSKGCVRGQFISRQYRRGVCGIRFEHTLDFSNSCISCRSPTCSRSCLFQHIAVAARSCILRRVMCIVGVLSRVVAGTDSAGNDLGDSASSAEHSKHSDDLMIGAIVSEHREGSGAAPHSIDVDRFRPRRHASVWHVLHALGTFQRGWMSARATSIKVVDSKALLLDQSENGVLTNGVGGRLKVRTIRG